MKFLLSIKVNVIINHPAEILLMGGIFSFQLVLLFWELLLVLLFCLNIFFFVTTDNWYLALMMIQSNRKTYAKKQSLQSYFLLSSSILSIIFTNQNSTVFTDIIYQTLCNIPQTQPCYPKLVYSGSEIKIDFLIQKRHFPIILSMF